MGKNKEKKIGFFDGFFGIRYKKVKEHLYVDEEGKYFWDIPGFDKTPIKNYLKGELDYNIEDDYDIKANVKKLLRFIFKLDLDKETEDEILLIAKEIIKEEREKLEKFKELEKSFNKNGKRR